MSSRLVDREETTRYVNHGNKRYVISYRWHYLNNGDKFHSLQVKYEMGRKPLHRWTWVTND